MEILRLTAGATAALYEELSALDRLCVGAEGWSADSFMSEAAKDNGIVLYITDGDRIAALLSGYTAVGEADITSVAVHPDYRRRGYAIALMERFEELLSDDTENIFLEVRESNAGAIALYEKCGFEKAGTRKRFYRTPVEDATIMVKNLKS